jgi:hypothetical protein
MDEVLITQSEIANVSPQGFEVREYKGPQRKKVAIVGFADSWVKAPFDDLSFEIWVCNEMEMVNPKRITRWFEPHSEKIANGDRAHNHINFLGQVPVPVYVQGQSMTDDNSPPAFSNMPTAKVIPLATLNERFFGWRYKGDPHEGYWTNTISMMIGVALLEGFDEIHTYGVNMAQDTEYKEQRASCEYMLGLAHGMGKKIYLPPESDLLSSPYIYGYEDEKANWLKTKLKAENDARAREMDNLRGQIINLQAELHRREGHVAANHFVIRQVANHQG